MEHTTYTTEHTTLGTWGATVTRRAGVVTDVCVLGEHFPTLAAAQAYLR
jgi:alkanesulfonate monooxygenase SsuD/methylene tetrahydromethanopterin reductase-like flavin-dependent oxidoreductase (luciferase family)